MNKKRIFLGIKISKELITKIQNWRRDYKHLNVNWIHEKDLHITIIPPWYEEIENIPKIVKLLEDNKEIFTPFSLNFKYIEVINNKKSKKGHIWVRAEANKEVIKLKRKLENILDRYPDNREYKPHVTLAKFGNIPRRAELDLPLQKGDLDSIDLKENIYHLDLLESSTTSGETHYIVLKKFSF